MRTLLLFLAACAAQPTTFDGPALAARASDADFTVPDEAVIYESLSYYLDDRPDFVEESLRRGDAMAPGLRTALADHGVPTELVAVAFVESGFQDIAARPPEFPGGGVWQFIPSTARQYGLEVDAGLDERHDLDRSTDAAARLLTDLHGAFGDWGAALAAYNQGPAEVRRAMAEQGTDDVWALIERGALNPYAARVMAAVILIEEREALGL